MKFPIFLACMAAGCMLAAADFRGSELFDRNRIVPEGMGVNIHFFDHESGMDALKSLDMRWLRMDITWDRVEREKGVYDFSQVDKLMNDAKARGLRVLAIIDYANKLYEPEQKVISEAGRRAYSAYAAALVRRYAGHDVIWEIWNEPNNSGFWPGNDPGEYMELVKAAVPAMREADPQAVILGPSAYRVAPEYMEACFKAGLFDYVDAVSFHPYRRHRPEEVLDDVAVLRELMRKYRGPGRELPPIVCSEWGFSATQHDGENGQALRVPRAALLSLMAGIDLYIYYDLWNDGGDATNSEHNYGLFTSPPFLMEKPAAVALKTVAKALAGFRFSRRIGAEENPNRFLLEFVSSSGEKRYAHWSDDEKEHEWRIPAGFGMFSRVTMTGQKRIGVYRPGDRLVSGPAVEYLIPEAAKPENWKVLGVLLPAPDAAGPWQAEPSAEAAVRGERLATGVRDLSGAVDYWFRPEKEDFGKTILTGGDLDRSFLTLEFRLDAEGRPSVRHRVRQGQKWLEPIGTNEAVPPGRWTRMTYAAGWEGRRLYINGQMVASAPAGLGPGSPAFHIAPAPLKGEAGQLKVISGDGFQL